MKLYTNVTVIFLIWISAIFIIFGLGFFSFPHSGKFTNDFFGSFANWDGGHYVGIAQYGYSEKSQYAFFPLYPLLIKAANQFIQNYTLSAVLVSLVATLLAVNAFYQLVSMDFGKKLAERSLLPLLLFPTSFYFITAYSEGLFFLLVILTFLFLRKGNLFLATIFAAAASATRLVGLAVVFALIIEVWSRGGFNRKNWYVVFSFSGFIIYSWFLFNATGDPFYYITAERFWLRSLAIPGIGFWETIKSIATPGFVEKNTAAFLDLIFAVFGMGMVLRSFRFLYPSYCIYGLVSLLVPLFTPSLSSMPRFLLPIFPIFILLGLVKNNYVNLAFQMISLMLLATFAILFINGYWVS